MPQRFEQGLYHISEDLIWLLLKLELWLLWWFTFARQEFKFGGALILRQVTVYVAKVVIRDT